MTKAEQARITAWRLRILQYAGGEPRQVAQTCRYFGISRTALYRWKRRLDELGEADLAWLIHIGRGNTLVTQARFTPSICGEISENQIGLPVPTPGHAVNHVTR
jgi:hypothetical protein